MPDFNIPGTAAINTVDDCGILQLDRTALGKWSAYAALTPDDRVPPPALERISLKSSPENFVCSESTISQCDGY